MTKSYQKTILILATLFVVLMFIPFESFAQCPMCRIAAESNLKDGGTAGAGLNAGILYMLAAPYLLVGTIGFIWWKNHKKIGK
ncbi:MAG: hypothetical protein IPP89_07665 [Saprospiraceae bacterium]|nr:hypothetical protein [Candidatus Brachybacter algidus]MBL0118850.1 hypothetical protein [Candidatus Brachybacter algidus]